MDRKTSKLQVGDIYGTNGRPNCVIIYEENDDYPQSAASIYECYELGQYGLGTDRLGSIKGEWDRMDDEVSKKETLFWDMDTSLLELIIVHHEDLLSNMNQIQVLFGILEYKYRKQKYSYAN